MRIHTNALSEGDIASHAGMPDDVTVHVVSRHTSRSHAAAYEVALRGHGTRHKRPPQTRDESMPGKAATFDDWGWYIAGLYRNDAGLIAGPYKNRTEFEDATKNVYQR